MITLNRGFPKQVNMRIYKEETNEQNSTRFKKRAGIIFCCESGIGGGHLEITL